MIAIDPGFAARGGGCACAVFYRGHLVAHGFARVGTAQAAALATMASDRSGGRIVVERPQVDRRTQGRERSTVDLAWHGAALAYWLAGATGATVAEYTPTEWKGNARKPQHHARLWAVLADAERQLLGGPATLAVTEAAKRAGAAERWRKGGGAAYYPSGWEMHNILDAVALGCHVLGRLP